MKDSLWSVDLFRSKSIHLRSHWLMVIVDQFSQRLIGFAVHVSDCDGLANAECLMKLFQEIRRQTI